jgi:hypothetical protein
VNNLLNLRYKRTGGVKALESSQNDESKCFNYWSALVVPIGNAYRSSKLVPDATLKEYPGAPHALISTSSSHS